MDAHYDLEGAAKELEEIAADRKRNENSGFQMSRSTKENFWPQSFNVEAQNKESHLIFNCSKKHGNEHETTEVVAHIQGILWRHSLPPFSDHAISAKRAKYLRQGVSLTGLGTPTFEASMQGILDVYALFSSHVSRHAMKNYENGSTYGNYSSIELSNRYFSSITKLGTEVRTPFSEEVDPYGILTRMESANHVHFESNVVDYYQRKLRSSGAVRYSFIPPARFQVGDIVEAQFIFLLVPVERRLHRLQLVLQGLTLLNNAYSQAALVARIAKYMPPSIKPKAVNIKRKKGYADEELAVTRKKLAHMEIDDPVDGQASDTDGKARTGKQHDEREMSVSAVDE